MADVASLEHVILGFLEGTGHQALGNVLVREGIRTAGPPCRRPHLADSDQPRPAQSPRMTS